MTLAPGDVLRVRVTNESAVSGSVAIEIYGQTRRAALARTTRTGRLNSSSVAEFVIQLKELGVQTQDVAAQFGVAVRTSYDDGVTDARYASRLYIEKSGSTWSATDSPSHSVALVSSGATPTPGADQIMRVSEPTSEILARLASGGIVPPANAVFLNATETESTLSSQSRGSQASAMADITVNFCFQQLNQYIDSGVGEDQWTETAFTFRGATGLYFVLVPSVGFGFYGFLNVFGCTGDVIAPQASWTASVYSMGHINSRFAQVMPCVGPNCTGATGVDITPVTIGNVNTSGIKTVQYWPLSTWESHQIAAVAMLGLARNPGTATDTYDIRSGAPQDGGGNPVWIKAGRADEKWLINHEFGHRFFAFNAPSVPWGPVNDYGIDETDSDCDSSSTSHNIETKEYVGSAFAEAVATFYAAMTFNDTPNNANCWISNPFFPNISATNPIDCAAGQTAIPLAYMDTKCNPGSDGVAGMGAEVDWLRQLWNLRTDNTGSAPPTLNAISTWMNISSMTRTNAFTVLNNAAQLLNNSLETNWDNNKAVQGIIH